MLIRFGYRSFLSTLYLHKRQFNWIVTWFYRSYKIRNWCSTGQIMWFFQISAIQFHEYDFWYKIHELKSKICDSFRNGFYFFHQYFTAIPYHQKISTGTLNNFYFSITENWISVYISACKKWFFLSKLNWNFKFLCQLR